MTDRWRRLRRSGVAIAGLLVVLSACGSPSTTATPVPPPWTGPVVRFEAEVRLPGDHELVDALEWQGRMIGVTRAPDVRSDSGFSAEIVTSSDGLTWNVVDTQAALRGATPVRLVPVGNGLVVLGTTGSTEAPYPTAPSAVYYSADAETWEDTTPSGMAADTLPAIATTAGGAVMVGRTADGASDVWVTADGRAWHQASLGDPADTHPETVAARGDRFILLGRTGPPWNLDGTITSSELSTPAMWSSTDGLSWERAAIDLPAAPQTGFGGAIDTPDGILAYGFGLMGAFAFWSSDGVSWTSAAGGTVVLGAAFLPMGCSSSLCVLFGGEGWPPPGGGTPLPTSSPGARTMLHPWVLTSEGGWLDAQVSGLPPTSVNGGVDGVASTLNKVIAVGSRFIGIGTRTPHPVIWLISVTLPD